VVPKVKDVMTGVVKKVVTIDTGASLLEACKLMSDEGVSSLVVTAANKIAGIVTERDCVRRGVAAEVDPKDMRIGDIMSKPVVTITPDKSIGEASDLMRSKGIRRLVVVDNDKLVGIITSDDIIKRGITTPKAELAKFLGFNLYAR